jgi:hypothetical protein
LKGESASSSIFPNSKKKPIVPIKLGFEKAYMLKCIPDRTRYIFHKPLKKF